MSDIVTKHDTDEGKYQSVFDAYGHGEGNGKSRQAVYAHYRKSVKVKELAKAETEFSKSSSSDSEDIPIESADSPTEDEGTSIDWGEISWAKESEGDDTADTIPSPIRGIAALGKAGTGGSAGLKRKQKELQGKMARWGFMMIDRLVTWWGRGVTNDPKYELARSDRDYDLLEETTTEVLDYYNLSIPVNPIAVWGVTVGSAYIPPIMDIRKKADPSRKRRFSLRGLFRRRRKPQYPQVKEDEENDFKP